MTDENTTPDQQPVDPTDAPGMYDDPDDGLSFPLPIGSDEDRIFNPDQPERQPLTRPSTAFERPPGNVYVIPADTELDPDGPAKFHADRVRKSAPSSDHPPIEATVRLDDAEDGESR